MYYSIFNLYKVGATDPPYQVTSQSYSLYHETITTYKLNNLKLLHELAFAETLVHEDINLI